MSAFINPASPLKSDSGRAAGRPSGQQARSVSRMFRLVTDQSSVGRADPYAPKSAVCALPTLGQTTPMSGTDLPLAPAVKVPSTN
jgi:hypothetical protein